MDYIILDLEWNQSFNPLTDPLALELPFEIIDIGAIKLDEHCVVLDEFDQLVKPQVYKRLHYITSKIIHLRMRDLMKGNPFPQVMREFLDWCGDDYIFCTWGTSDLVELQRNMRYYYMTPLHNGPLRFLDVQKLFSIAYEDGKTRRALEWAIDFLRLPKDSAFHRAFSDAYYTARILSGLPEGVLRYFSYDTFILPQSRAEEIHADFGSYHKYTSVEFANKDEALSDREVMSTCCYRCEGRRSLKRKIKWFSGNGKQYYNVAYCPVHGYMKSKLRLKKTTDEGVYVVKTAKFISQEDFTDIFEKMKTVKEKTSTRRRRRRR
ncbi:MAG: exonuclease domain-containing protein [Lachnospiraceae bacterium]|jgi:DNA polymerase III epsilon subunit-like protein|nr:exonuclease domain-containing protein [Lachnospiraceae bacterium]